MSPAKRVTARIRKPRKDVELGKARNFTVARPRKGASPSVARKLPLAAAAYALSVHDPRDLPHAGAPEIAFAGRSNAGKSSAINALSGRRRLAFVGKTPGRTQLINFFSLGGAGYLVDLPGYGYAGVPGAVREHWKGLVGGYIAHRPSLAGVVVVMDARHPLTDLDVTLLEWLRDSGRRAHVLLTKSDKLSKQAGQATLARVRSALAERSPGSTAQLFSSLKREGIEEAARAIARLLDPGPNGLRSAESGKNKAPAKGE
jgi:GTP-binding protein